MYCLKLHSPVPQVSQQFECKECGCHFQSPLLLETHTQSVQSIALAESKIKGTEPSSFCFKCPKCSRRFQKESSMAAHSEIHNRQPTSDYYPCSCCELKFTSVGSLIDHLVQQHPEAERHKCNQCESSFVLHAHLIEHLGRHRGSHSRVCVICEKGNVVSALCDF